MTEIEKAADLLKQNGYRVAKPSCNQWLRPVWQEYEKAVKEEIIKKAGAHTYTDLFRNHVNTLVANALGYSTMTKVPHKDYEKGRRLASALILTLLEFKKHNCKEETDK